MVVKDKILARKLASINYSEANKALKEVIAQVQKGVQLTSQDLKYILNIPEKSLIGDFLIEIDSFTEEQLKIIENYVISNFDHEDRDFVSDLIDVATTESLNLPYTRCLQLLNNSSERESYVVSSVISYIMSQPKFNFIDEIFLALTNILEDSSFYQNAQVKASFCLFRMTHDKKYLQDLIDLVEEGQEINRELLKNILLLDCNSSMYFHVDELERYR